MKITAKLKLLVFFLIIISVLTYVCVTVVTVDPFFHYHKPNTETYYYELNNQRSQNDGIIRHFDYDALITGSSMTENFSTSEMDEIYGTNSIKVPFSGGSFREINDWIQTAITENGNLKTVVRGLDLNMFFQDKDALRPDLGEYPNYLYNESVFDDVYYVFNRDVIFARVFPMIENSKTENAVSGIDSFDVYSSWMTGYTYGINTVRPNGIDFSQTGKQSHLSESERERLLEMTKQNITSLPQQYPDVEFYYFFTPYSAVWWKNLVADGSVYKQIEAERVIIEEALKYDNLKLFSFNNLTEITTDINNYKDTIHYGSWINSLILRYMYSNKCLLTSENYNDYLNDELSFYTTFDYASLVEQEDYENDYLAANLVMKNYT